MSWYSPVNLIKRVGKGTINPLWNTADDMKSGFHGINDLMGRGYDSMSDKQKDIYSLWDNNKSNINDIYDPSLRKRQVSALDRLIGISENPNLDAISKSQLNQIRQQEGQLEKGSRDAIMMNANERGAGTSTGNLLDQIVNNQKSAERRTNQDTDILANQQQRALDALYGSINTAGSINSADMNRANALDLFNRYNISGKAGSLGAQGQISADKAAAQNQFWGQILGTGAGLVSGNPGFALSKGGTSGMKKYGDYALDDEWSRYA